MKIRMGFVSNSSSSSFCIYGACLNEELLDIIQKKQEITEDDLEQEGWCEFLEELASELGLEYHSIDYDTHYLGRSFASIKDNETGKEFKASVRNALKKYFGQDVSTSTHDECGYC